MNKDLVCEICGNEYASENYEGVVLCAHHTILSNSSALERIIDVKLKEDGDVEENGREL